jgi:hypothetical protein
MPLKRQPLGCCKRSLVSNDSPLLSILNSLVDGWCERRALAPLARILVAYPLSTGLSDETHQLWQALRNVRGLSDTELLPLERAQVEEALRILGKAFKEVGQDPFQRT